MTDALRRNASPVLVHRDDELARLMDGFRRSEAGQAVFTLVSGEPGVGKTRLVLEHARRVADRGGQVLVGECLELGDTSLPYGPFRDIFRSLPATAAGTVTAALDSARAHSIAAGGRSVTTGAARGGEQLAALGELNAGVLAALEQLAGERPVLLFVDDLHCIDPASRELLTYLVRRTRDLRIQVVGTFRNDALQRRHHLVPFLAEAERWPMTERVRLDPLDRAGIAALIEAISGEPPGRSLVDEVHRRSDGNPFFAEELVAAGDAAGRGLGTLHEVLEADLARLSDGARSVLAAAAVLGRRPGHDLLVSLVGDGPATVAAIRECVAQRLLVVLDRPDEPAYEFRHALVQELAYEDLLPAERRALHGRASAVLADGVDLSGQVAVARAGEIAHHAHRANDQALALAAADAAGRAALATFAHADANRWLTLALDLWDRVPPAERPATDHGDLLGLAAQAAAYGGDPHRAARLQRRRLDLVGTAEVDSGADLLHDLFWFHWDAAEIDAYPGVAAATIELVPADPPSWRRARALADLAFARWSVCDNREAERLAREAADVARAAGDAGAEGTALQVLGMALAGLGRTTAADEPFALALERLRQAGDADGLARAAHWWANTLELDGRFEQGLAVATDGLRAAMAAGVESRHGDSLRAVIAENLQELGRWDEALGLASGSFDWGEDVPAEIWLHGVTARILIARGDLAAARQHVEASEDVPALGPDRIWQLEEQVNLAYATGDVDAGRHALGMALGAATDPTSESSLWWILHRVIEGEVAGALEARRAGDDPLVADHAAQALGCLALLERSGVRAREAGGTGPLLDAHLAWAAATRARLDGRADPGAWRVAVEQRDLLGQQLDAATGRVRLAEALREAGGQDEEIVATLDEARRTAERLGLAPVLREIAALSPSPTAPAGAAATGRAGPLGLSPREEEVLALVAAGRTNREIGEALFISPKTASAHVTHILDKLGVSSRVEAALVGAAALRDVSSPDAKAADAGAPGRPPIRPEGGGAGPAAENAVPASAGGEPGAASAAGRLGGGTSGPARRPRRCHAASVVGSLRSTRSRPCRPGAGDDRAELLLGDGRANLDAVAALVGSGQSGAEVVDGPRTGLHLVALPCAVDGGVATRGGPPSTRPLGRPAGPRSGSSPGGHGGRIGRCLISSRSSP